MGAGVRVGDGATDGMGVGVGRSVPWLGATAGENGGQSLEAAIPRYIPIMVSKTTIRALILLGSLLSPSHALYFTLTNSLPARENSSEWYRIKLHLLLCSRAQQDE